MYLYVINQSIKSIELISLYHFTININQSASIQTVGQSVSLLVSQSMSLKQKLQKNADGRRLLLLPCCSD